MYDLRFGSSAPTARDEGIGAADSPTGEAISAEAMEDAPASEEERLDGLLADVEEMERAQEIAAAGLSGRNADEIEAKERYVGTEAAKAVEKVVTSLRGKVKDAVTRAELEERVSVEERKGLISQEDELIMPANEGVIDAVKAATGRDVTGYYHAVSEEKIWHAVSKHSHDSTSKVYSNQLDLTWDDFALLPDILDTGKPGVEKWKGDTVISYTKEYGNICFKVLQRIGRKRRHGTSRLMFVTEWIEKTAGRKGLAPVKARDQVPSSPGEVIQARGVEDVKGKNLVNGMYAEAGDGSVYGVARVEDLSISADVPQFKKKEVAGQREAANEDGTTHELSGGWNAKSAPIIVWRRRDGRLEVISGRHRLAHAKKNGVQHIAVRVYDEDAVHDAAWAKLYDVEVNILEGTCGAIDVAFYFRHNPMSLAEAEARGLMPKTQAGGQTAASRMGIMIATRASGYVFDSLVNGGVSAEDAYMACVITESAEGQELALKARRGTKGKKRSWEYVTALVRGAEQMAPEGGSGLMDLFGFDEGFANRAKKMADYVEAVRRQLRRRIDVLSGAGSLQRKGEMTKEMGVKIDRPEDAVRIIERLARLDAAYEAMEPGLGIAAAAEAWDGKSDVQIDWRRGEVFGNSEQLSGNSEQVGDGSFSVSARFLGTAQEALKIREEAMKDGTYLKAPNGEDSKLDEQLWGIVRTRAFKDYFGDWENDPEGASKVVDSNGEPLVVYHGTVDDVFHIFDRKASGKYGVDGDAETPARSFLGHWFSAQKAMDGVYPHVMKLFLNIRSPYEVESLSELDALVNGGGEEAEKIRTRRKRGNDFYKSLVEDGYDGIVVKYDAEYWDTPTYIAFSPEQIKSVDNRGTFDGGSGDISMSVRNLAAVHTLSVEKFLAAGKMGGMPLPSVAVTRLDRPYDWMRDKGVTLVARPEMVDPERGAKVYSRDAWTGVVDVRRVVKRGKERSEILRKMDEMLNAARDAKYEHLDDLFHLRAWIYQEGRRNEEAREVERLLRGLPGMVQFAWERGQRGSEQKLTGYARRSSKAFAAWVDEKLDALYGRAYINGTRKEATLENVTEYMLGRKEHMGETQDFAPTWTQTMAKRARELGSMEEVKGQREELVNTETSDEQKRATFEKARELSRYLTGKYGRGKYDGEAVIGNLLLEMDSEVGEEATAEDVRRFWRERGGREDVDDEMVRLSSEALEALRAEREDYLEAVPQRAVRMNEWAYALYSENLEGKDEVRRVCLENGIVPVEYKAGERDKALGDLIDDGDVSFSVSEARERGLMKDGVMEVGNGVIVDGGADFSASVDFSHVSRALFRRPDREHVGTGEGNQVYGWGCIYGAENPMTNREYHKQFTTEGLTFVKRTSEGEQSVPAEEVIEGLKKRGVGDAGLVRATTYWGKYSTKQDLIFERDRSIEERDKNEFTPRLYEYYDTNRRIAEYFLENDIFVAGKEKRYPVNYRMRADVDDSNVLLWDESFDYFWANHEEVQDALKALLPADVFDSLWGGEDGYGIWQAITGGGFYEILTKQLGSPRAASEWLDEHGIRGVKYLDGLSRGRRERGEEDEPYTYNYVIFNPDYIEVIAINNRHEWSEYSEGNGDWERVEEVFGDSEQVDVSASVGMWKGRLGALRESFPEDGTAAYTQEIFVCPTPAVMQMVGARALDMVTSAAVIYKVTKKKHAVSWGALEQLPEAMADPVCIAVSKTPGCLEVITELEEEGKNILVAVQLNVTSAANPSVMVNRIASLYGKDSIGALLKHRMLYWNEAKARIWMNKYPLQLRQSIHPMRASDARVLTPQDLVKYKMRHGMSFSVRGEGLLDRVNLREMAEEEKMSRLMTRARRGAERWRRVFMDDKTSAAEAARALGEVSSVMEAVYMYLPAGERPVYAGKMRLVEAYARLVETGRVWHRENAKSEGARAKQEVLDEVMGELERVSTVKGEARRELREGYVREVAGRKLSEVAVSMVEDAVDAVERHLVRREMDVVKRLAEALKPKKLKSGKPAPGKMSAAGYRRFERYMKMVEMSAEEKAERMEELAGKLDKESEAEKQEPIEEEMRELATFGALGSGKLADVRRGVRELVGFVRAERTSWEGRVELEKEQMAHFARVAVEAMGGVDRNKLAARRDRAKKPLRTILGTQKGFMSLGQMWMAMQGVPALREMAEWSLERLARGNVALGMRERALREAEVAFMAKELGLTSEAARNNFLVDLKKERATGVRKAGEKRVHKVRVTIEEAREIVAMNF